jgi:hypothetical protein
MADSRLLYHGGFKATIPWRIPGQHELMADSSRHDYGRLACCTRHSIGLSLELYVVSAPEPS